jgi:mRNA-degrading endonuclease toxin of MazEF toxin-antitoxin module
MKPRQWEIWKAKPPGFEREHWFVIVSGDERCDETRQVLVNGLACFSLRGDPRKSEVRLNGADGFTSPTVCQCDFLYSIPKSILHSNIGNVTWERQQQIKSKLKEVFRL